GLCRDGAAGPAVPGRDQQRGKGAGELVYSARPGAGRRAGFAAGAGGTDTGPSANLCPNLGAGGGEDGSRSPPCPNKRMVGFSGPREERVPLLLNARETPFQRGSTVMFIPPLGRIVSTGSGSTTAPGGSASRNERTTVAIATTASNTANSCPMHW